MDDIVTTPPAAAPPRSADEQIDDIYSRLCGALGWAYVADADPSLEMVSNAVDALIVKGAEERESARLALDRAREGEAHEGVVVSKVTGPGFYYYVVEARVSGDFEVGELVEVIVRPAARAASAETEG